MHHIRTTKTSSAATAVQVVKYVNRKMIIVAHIGSAHNSEELIVLKKTAAVWIEKKSKQRSLFPLSNSSSANFIQLDKCQYLGVSCGFIYEVLMQIVKHFGFCSLTDKKMLVDLVIIRIIEPASKLHSIELLDELFNIKYLRKNFYCYLPEFILLKNKTENKILALAKNEFNFDFSLVFYDVTTLYFETFQSDEFRKPGFSKDNKSQQPQILIGLIVDSQGFPIAYEMFEGNKFEGKTFIPIISDFKRKHDVDKLTIVADAAMLSMENIEALKANRFSYIVGARVSNLPKKLICEISLRLGQKDRKNIRIETEHGQLICDFSAKRYHKDSADMDKQIIKAKILLKNPAQAKRIKFVKGKNKTELELNKELIEKTKLLLGIKGYYTNLSEDVGNATIIKQYHNLWHVEQTFRVAKSDLEIRPIFHFKQQTIEVHLLICFMALAICKYMEIKTGKSTRQIVKILKSITDARIKNTLNGEEITMRSKITADIKQILLKLGLSY
ncbi:MAG: IS1634 family transposase [Ignavibacteria bacterium]|nr:IS1634 family transposase [Ignavibacteria bacterium]